MSWFCVCLFLNEIQLLDRQVRRVLALLQTHELSPGVENSHTGHQHWMKFCFPVSLLEISTAELWWFLLFFFSFQDFSHSQICVVVLHCWFHLHFSNANEVENIFMLFTICMSLMRCLFKSSTNFSIWLFVFIFLNFKKFLYILDTFTLSYVCIANIFSLSVTFLLFECFTRSF